MPIHRPEECILVVAPVGQDAPAIAGLLQKQGYQVRVCQGARDALEQLSGGAGTLLLTEEALHLEQFSALLDRLKAQPAWSELPLIVLTTGGETRMTELLDLVALAAGNVMLLERPLAEITLLRSVEVAVRSRRRQYQVRDLLQEQHRKRQELERVKSSLQQAEEHLERQVAERTADLRATNEQLEAFVYSIAHDLRSPLRAMIGYSELLVEDYAAALADTPRTLLQRIQTSSAFMDRLLLDLLDYGRTARAEMNLAPVELQRVWENALFQCATQAAQAQARVEAVGSLPSVLAHEATLGQCLTNLLNNALKFVPPGIPPHVRCRAEDRGQRVRVIVEDNGVGIAPSQHERIFRVFERLDGSRQQGTGIGLSIVRKGVERMGGTVGLDSAPGQGSRFWIELPKAEPGESGAIKPPPEPHAN